MQHLTLHDHSASANLWSSAAVHCFCTRIVLSRSWSSGLQMNEEDRFSAVQRAPVSDAKPLKGAAPTPVAANGSRTSAWSIPGSGATIVSGGR